MEARLHLTIMETYGELDEKLESRMDGSRLSVDCEEDRLVPLTVSLQGSELQGIIISDGSFSLE